MKKAYSKPEIMFEDFSLSSSITLGCKAIVNHVQYTCPYKTVNGRKEVNVFLEGMDLCTTTDSDGEYDGFCYHNPSENNALFTS